MAITDLDTWSRCFAEFTASFAHRFPRIESRRQATSYLRGLLSELERKNGWTLAEVCGEQVPERLQRLLNFYAWDTDGVRDDVRDLVVEALGDPHDGVLILDDTGFLKKARSRPGWPASTRVPQGGSRTARSVCSWPTPAPWGGR